ncbi:MAG: recombinase zinc beta ribbon domain-containing protein [Rubrobacteraceae bacterium]|nr:recombinase zinc beta ribbon domain-containing protein [Rubrobacteraceae bacterium]
MPASLDRDLVERARAMAAANRGSERKHLARKWELRGLVRCSCGLKMATQTTSAKASRPYYYYRCNRSKDYGTDACSRKAVPAQKVERLVWGFVFDLLKDPERVRAGMEALIDRERETGIRRPAEEAAGWAEKLDECDRLRGAYQDQQAAGLMTLGELGSKLESLEETRRLARAELAALQARVARTEELERDRDALLESWANALPEALDGLTGQERNKVYKMLRLEVTPTAEGFGVTGALAGFLCYRTDATVSGPV